tara:strand:+ start:842 stop:1000 length:159 start_codon:yes stop_codon:yes gene_type:complete
MDIIKDKEIDRVKLGEICIITFTDGTTQKIKYEDLWYSLTTKDRLEIIKNTL